MTYSLNNSGIWTDVPMTLNSTTGLYEATIPGQQTNTLVKYRIAAYDNAGNYKVEDNNGQYYVYTVIPEFPSLDTTPPTISILSPENKTYLVSDVSLTFTVSESTSWIGYSLNGQDNVTISGNTTLVGLSDDTYTITVYANDTAGNMGSSDTVYFTIQTPPIDTTPPNISVTSPENKTYALTEVPLTFTVDESVSWMAYSLDNEANMTITGNTTLSGLSDGSHSMVVYTRDTAGNIGASEIVYFTIETPEQEPFPTLIVAAIVIITVIGAVVVVYFTKFKK